LAPNPSGARHASRWQCSKGHVWNATLNSIKHQRSWCPICSQQRRRLTIGDAVQVATKRGGWCLSDQYRNNRSPLLWRCAEGHEWKARLNNVRNCNSWCPECAQVRSRISIDLAAKVAAKHGGQCLSNGYDKGSLNLRWRCAHGHEWNASLNAVKNNNAWCPQCVSSTSENDVRRIFECIFPGYHFPRCRPSFLKGRRGWPLELDGFCSELKMAFEYQGEQHYDPTHFFVRHIEGAYDELCARDMLKVALCNAVCVRLVVVPCTVKDRWSFIRLCLLRWFPMSRVNPGLLSP